MALQLLTRLHERGFRPSVDLCEREIVANWLDYCAAQDHGDPSLASVRLRLVREYADLRAASLPEVRA
ncbi:hypothetical protein [uncultured Arenimonas sp.]|uniref:hypothetical protein n=1 Tax=uncultured Arenimonas sp. TaxID=546226 RepID=UPI0030DBD1C0